MSHIPASRLYRALAMASALTFLGACSDRSISDNHSQDRGEHPPVGEAPAPRYPSFSVDGEQTYTQVINSGYHFNQYLYYNGDWGWQHTFPLYNTPGITITSAKLLIYAYDVDAEPFHGADGEYDAISVDGTRLNPGFLQGSNNAYSTTTFDVPVSSITDDGVVNAFIDIDIYHNTPTWATSLISSTLVITYTTGPVNQAPYMPTLSGTPATTVGDNQDLTVSVTGPSPADPDNDPVTYEYRWFLNTGSGGFLDPSIHGRGTFTSNTIPASATQPGDQWRVQVTPRDSHGAIGPYGTYTFNTVIADVTPPVITPHVSGTQGTNDWYTGDVGVSFTVVDNESAISSKIGCDAVTVSANTAGTTFTCTATSAGGTDSKSVTVKRDATPPTISGSVSGPPGSNGWFVGDVAITFTASDDISGVSSTAGCAASQTTDTPDQSFSCTVTNGAGLTASTTVHVKRDATKPLVAIAGNAGSYTVDQTVNITCTFSDAMSGVASQTCNGASGPAYSLGLGSHNVSASATDYAGNSQSAAGSFTVNVTTGSLCTLVRRWVSQNGIANSLCTKLDNAQAAMDRGNAGAADNVLDAFINDVQAQSGKAVPSDKAAILISLATALK